MTTATNEQLIEDLKELVRDAEELMKATAGQAGEKLTEVRGRLSVALESAKQTCDQLQEETADVTSATGRCIRRHPYETIGVAFGLGLLLGVLVGRK
jgi:ElaB/YqjD/DUF883 family membrane-anchored ribosome-binding protein